MLCLRYLSSTAATTVNKENPASDTSSKDNSGQGKDSRESYEKSDARKPLVEGWVLMLL